MIADLAVAAYWAAAVAAVWVTAHCIRKELHR